MRLSPLFPTLALLLACAAGCNREPATGTGIAGGDSAATLAASAMDEKTLRAAISTSIREQRLYAPAGNNAIEWYLQLRNRVPDDRETNNALMEMEPYAVIAAEQSLSRREFDEAQRLIELIQRANGTASALPRLREQLARQRAQPPATEAQALAVQTTIEPAMDSGLPAAAPVKPLPLPTASLPAAATIAEGRVQASKTPALEQAPTPVAIMPAPSSSPTAAVVDTRADARTPAQLRDRSPRYPAAALNRKIEGSVELVFTIKADGSVTDVRVLSANPPGIFEEAAIATTRYWQFEALGRDMPSRRSIYFNLPKQAP